MQCVILAGGLGSRIRVVDERVPKVLLKVAGRPFADWQLSWLAAQDVTSVLYCIGHKGALVREYVGDGGRWQISVAYSEDGDALLGTGGAVRQALDRGLVEEEFLLLYGDSYLQVSLAAVEAQFRARPEPALMTVYRNCDLWDASNAVYRDGKVVRYEKGVKDQPVDMCWIDYGLSVLDRRLVETLVPPSVPYDVADVFSDLSRSGHLAGYPVRERFFEIGTPRGLAQLERYLSARGDHA